MIRMVREEEGSMDPVDWRVMGEVVVAETQPQLIVSSPSPVSL